MKVRNTPLPASWLKNAKPDPLPPSGLGRGQPQGDADDQGKDGGHRQQQQVAPAQQDEPELGGVEPTR